MKRNSSCTENRILDTKMLQKKMGIGRDKAYALMRSAGFPSMRIGARYLVIEDKVDQWLEQCAYRDVAV